MEEFNKMKYIKPITKIKNLNIKLLVILFKMTTFCCVTLGKVKYFNYI